MGRGRWKRGDFGGTGAAWQQGYANAGQNLKNGVAQPKRDPTQAAIAAKDSLVQGFNQAVTSGQWANGLQRAGLAGWQQGMNTYAANGLAQKAQKGAPHVSTFAQTYGPALMQQVANLPARGPAGQNQSRSATLNDWAHQQRGKYRHAWRQGVL